MTDFGAHATLETACPELTTFVDKECFFIVVEAFAKCKKKEELDMTEIRLRAQTDADIKTKAYRSLKNNKYTETVVSSIDAEVVKLQEIMHNTISVQKSRRLNDLTADIVTPEQVEQLAAFGTEIASGVQESGRLLSTKELDKKFDPFWKQIMEVTVPVSKTNVLDTANDLLLRFYKMNKKEISQEIVDHPLTSPLNNLSQAFHSGEFDYEGNIVYQSDPFEKEFFRDLLRSNKSPHDRIKDMLASIERFIKSLKRDIRNVDACVYAVIKKVHKVFEDQANQHENFKFTPACERKAAVQVMRFAIPILRQMENALASNLGLSRKMTERREKALKILKGIVRHKEIDEGLPNVVCSGIESHLVESIDVYLQAEVAKEVQHLFSSKETLIALRHQKFVENRLEFDCYLDYLSDLREQTHQCFLEWVREQYFTKQPTREQKISLLALKHIGFHVDKVKNALCKLPEQTTSKHHKSISFSKLLDKLVLLLTKEGISIRGTPFSYIDKSIKIDDVAKFTEKTMGYIDHYYLKKLCNKYREVTFESNCANNDRFRELFDDVWGCDAMCPT